MNEWKKERTCSWMTQEQNRFFHWRRNKLSNTQYSVFFFFVSVGLSCSTSTSVWFVLWVSIKGFMSCFVTLRFHGVCFPLKPSTSLTCSTCLQDEDVWCSFSLQTSFIFFQRLNFSVRKTLVGCRWGLWVCKWTCSCDGLKQVLIH